MKKFLSVFILLAALLLPSAKISAAAPPQKDGVIFSGKTDCGKRIALTFDDGPHPTQTMKILELLDEYGVKATFFVIGENAEYYPEIVAQEVSRGHEVGNHSFSHPNMSKFTEDEISAEIRRTDEAIKRAAGITPRIFRPPEGAYTQSVVRAAEKTKKQTVIWTVDTMDWAKSPCDKIVENVKSNVTSGSIILYHDHTHRDAHTYESLAVLIPYLKAQGYEFVTVSELVGR
jgi:polysaccharide deacetylase family sporulation protein PdaB